MPQTEPLHLAFQSNALLQDLCGRHDTNLQLIEDRLGVQLVAKGNQLAIFGPGEQAGKARAVLEDLYDLVKSGVALSPSQVEAQLRMTDGLLDTRPKAAEVLNGPQVIATPNLKILPRSRAQGAYIGALQTHTLVFGVGPAGTGKTMIAAAHAVQLLMQKQVNRIVLTRPVLEAGERLGFLPGTFEEKLDPYLRPLFDALDATLGRERWLKMRDAGQIEIAPLAYMRGRTLSDSALILDEAQNTTPLQMRMFLTRLGEGSHMMVTGDPTQSDLPRNTRNGLKDALDTLESLRDIEVVRFGEADVVRHPLVSSIVQAYAEKDRQLSLKIDH
jgi:phosphate starvation-inducible PhoH-like protein